MDDNPSPKLVVLCDGMWCSAETKSETNLRMLARLIGIDFEKRQDSLHDGRRRARYFPGPGLGNPLDLVVGNRIGDDIATRCIDIYAYIADNFAEGCELWMFGLGRGAYVIRCVAGMIEKCGIVRARSLVGHDETRALACRAYAMYVDQAAGSLPSSSMSKFKSTSSWAVEKPIRFIGLLDTTSPKGFAALLPSLVAASPMVTWLLPAPRRDDADFLRAVEHVCHAVAIHERLPFFDPCPLRWSEDDDRDQARGTRNVHEKWFPGLHYDLGRQEFSFQSLLGAGVANSPVPSWLLGQRIRPNAVISDLVLGWMLEKIQAADRSGSVVPDASRHIEELRRGFTSGARSTGSGDIYESILRYTPLGPLRLWWRWLWIPDFFTQRLAEAKRRALEFVLGLKDRTILDVGAETYDYKRQFDQSGETIEKLAQVSRARYPSNAYDDFQLFRCLMGEIDQDTFLCLSGRDRHPGEMPQSEDLHRHMVLDIKWQGPDFYKLHCGAQDKLDWNRVLTITKASPTREHYIARTVSGFLSEFYGDLGTSLLQWVEGLCTSRMKVASEEEETEEGQPPRVLDRVHLHVSEDSISACFEDGSFDWKMPAASSDTIDEALSAFRWVVATFQNVEETSGVFRIGCRGGDDNKDWTAYHEPFAPDKKECSCWTQLFDVACVGEMPPSLQVDVGDRPEGLEIDWDQLMGLTDVSRFLRNPDGGVVLLGLDTALVQLAPIETRRWHVVRGQGTSIFPWLPGAMAGTPPSTLNLQRESEARKIVESLSADPTGLKEGAMKTWVRLRQRSRETRPDLEDKFGYARGKVYVGWCSEPIVTIGSSKPSEEFLDRFDRQTNVPEVTNNIVALANVNDVQVWNLGAKLGFMGFGVDGGYARHHGEQRAVQPLAAEVRLNHLFRSQLRSARLTPCILWDDTLRRAWLVPGTCALLFASLCYFARLGLSFDRDIQYATPSNDAAMSAQNCLLGNQLLQLTTEGEPDGVTFGRLVLDMWEDMQKAQAVCRSTVSNRKHVRPGVVFGYDLYDLLGPGRVALRYLDERVAGPSLRGWEPLARLENTQVIFCNSVGQVIVCVSRSCPGAPCQGFCESASRGTSGILSCLLQDFKTFFSKDWDSYAQSGTLLVRSGFEWVPRGPDPFGHSSHHPHVPGSPCQCCARLDRLQAIMPVRRFFLTRVLRRWLVRDDRFNNAVWLNQPLAVRFGAVGV